jgi:RNA polymerase sigma-70 factor (ECF subfamily)
VTDQELVDKARDGDVPAFEALVGRHHRAALRAALAALGSAQDADDVTQEAWMAAHARLGDFRGQASFRTWLLTIVWNKALDRRREVGRWLKRLVQLDAGWEARGEARRDQGASGVESAIFTRSGASSGAAASGGSGAGGASGWPSPEAQAVAGDLSRRMRRLVRALPAKLRDPLLLAGSGDYTYDEMAAMLGVPAGTVKWRVFEARRRLKAKLQRLGYE